MYIIIPISTVMTEKKHLIFPDRYYGGGIGQTRQETNE